MTWPIADRIQVILQGLGRSLPDDALATVIEAHERMEVEIPPELIEGCDEALAQLSQRYALAIVSDAIVTPGRCFGELLEKHGVKNTFPALHFRTKWGTASRIDRCLQWPQSNSACRSNRWFTSATGIITMFAGRTRLA